MTRMIRPILWLALIALAGAAAFGAAYLPLVNEANASEWRTVPAPSMGPWRDQQEAFSLRRSVPVEPPIVCSDATLTFDLVDDEAEVSVTSADVFDEPGGSVVDTAALGEHAVVTSGGTTDPQCAEYPGGEGVQWYELTGIGWLPESQITFFIQPPPEGGAPAHDFEVGNDVWRVIGSANGNVRATPAGTLICQVEPQIRGTILVNDFGTCDAVDADGDACREALGGVTNIWWYKWTVPAGVSAACPAGFTGWTGDDQLELAPALPVNSFAAGAPARKDDDGTSTDLFGTPAGADIGNLDSGQYCIVSSAQTTYASGAHYWSVDCPNVGVGWALDTKLESTAAPPFGPFLLGALVDHTSGNVRATPAGSIVGPLGDTQATITGGPRYAEGVSGGHNHWWQSIDAAVDGWVGVNRLSLANPPPPGDPGITPPTANTTITVTGCALTGGTGSTASLGNAINAAPSGSIASPHVTRIVLPSCTVNFGASATLPTFSDRTKEYVIDNGPNQGTWNRTAAAQVSFNGPTMGSGSTVTSFTHVDGDLQLTLASVPASCAVGAIAKFYSLNDPIPGARLSQSTGANNSRMGELFEIESVTSTTIRMTEALTNPSRWTNSSATLRVACRAKSSRVWLMDARNDGSEDYLAPQLNFTRMDDLRVVRPWHRRNGRQYIFLNFTWRALVYDPDIGIGRSDTTNNYWARGIEDRANKHTLVACTGTKINGFDHRHFYDTTGSVQNPSSPDAYGTEYFGTLRGCLVQDMRDSYLSTHEASVGYLYEDAILRDTNKNSNKFCMTHRGSGVAEGKTIMRRVTCDTERGIQDGIAQFDGQAGDLDCEECTLTTNSERWSVGPRLTGSVKRIINSTCNGTVSSIVQKVGSNPGC